MHLGARGPAGIVSSPWLVRIGAGGLLAGLLAPWYEVHRPAVLGPAVVDGWQAFVHTDLILAGLAALAGLVGCFMARRRAWWVEAACGAGALVLGAAALTEHPAIPPRATAAHTAATFVAAHAVRVGPVLAIVAAALILAGALGARRAHGPDWGRAPGTGTMLGAIVVAGGVLRFSTLADQSYWYDEFATIAVIRPHLGAAWSAYQGTESTPPLYYALAWAWARLTGTDEFAVRALPAAFGTAAIGVTWLAAREVTSRRLALVAAALVAVNPTLVWYSQEARAYSLLVLLGALSLWAFLAAVRDPRRRTLAGWAVVSILALATHYFALFVIAPEAAVLVLRLARRRPRVLVPVAAVGAAGLALLPLTSSQGGGARTSWIATISLDDRLASIAKQLASANTLVINENTGLPHVPLAAAVVVGLMLVAYRAVLAVIGGRRRTGAGLPLLVGASAIMLPLAAILVGEDFLLDRNVLAAWVPLTVALAAALVLVPRWLAVVAMGLALAAGALVDLDVARSPGLQRADWRDAVHALGRPAGGRLLVVNPSYARGLLPFYGNPSSPPAPNGIVASELDFVGTYPVASKGVPPGFSEIARLQIQQVAVLRLRADRPVLLTPGNMAAVGVDPHAVLVEFTPRARRWSASFGTLVEGWRAALRAPASARSRVAAIDAANCPGVAAAPGDVPDGARLARLATAACTAASAWAAGGPGTGAARRFDGARAALERAASIRPVPATAVAVTRAQP